MAGYENMPANAYLRCGHLFPELHDTLACLRQALAIGNPLAGYALPPDVMSRMPGIVDRHHRRQITATPAPTPNRVLAHTIRHLDLVQPLQGAIVTLCVTASPLRSCCNTRRLVEWARLKREVYLVDMANGENRAAYEAVSKTAIGALMLVGGLVGFVADWLGTASIILLLGLLSLFAAFYIRLLPEVSDHEPRQ